MDLDPLDLLLRDAEDGTLFLSSAELLRQREQACCGSVAVMYVHRKLMKDQFCTGCEERKKCEGIFKEVFDRYAFLKGCFGQRKEDGCFSCPLFDDCKLVSEMRIEIGAEKFVSSVEMTATHGGLPSVTSDELEEMVDESETVMTKTEPSGSTGGIAGVTVEVCSEMKKDSVSEIHIVVPSVEEASVEEAATVETSPSSVYRFPDQEDDYVEQLAKARDMADEELLDAFAALSDAARSGSSYASLRPRWCALATVLNERQVLPPVLRAKLSVPVKRKHETKDQTNASNDRQVLDLHWLHCTGFQPCDPRWEKILSGDFDFPGASEFVRTMGSGANKAKTLGLARKDMLLLAVLCDDATRKRQTAIRNQTEDRIGHIRDAMLSAGCRLGCSEKDMANISHALQLADQDVVQAVRVLHQCSRMKIDKQTMARRKRWLLEKKIIHPVGAPTGA